MKYNKTASILGPLGGGRMRKDSIKRVHVTRAGVKVETRKGKRVVWFIMRPWKLMHA